MDPAGEWEGTIEVQGQQIAIRVLLSRGPRPQGTIDIPAQGARGLPLQNVQLDGNTVYFELVAGPGVAIFDGRLNEGCIQGVFHQAGVAGVFAMTPAGKSGSGSASNAAQPGGASPNRAWVAEEVALPVGGGRLFGTLLIPRGAETHPVVLLIAGSGPTNRDGNSPLLPGENHSLQLLAEALAERGFASLRYDKRGVAESVWKGLREENLLFEDYVRDALGWVRMLQANPRFTGVSVIGHSEGGLVGLAAAREAELRALVLLAAAGRPLQDTLLLQLRDQPRSMYDEIESIIRRLERGERVERFSAGLEALFRPSVQPYLISIFRYDPRQEIRRVRGPVLIVQGTRDLQVGEDDARLLKGARPEAELALIEGMNHVLKTVGEGRESNLEAYSDATAPLSAHLVETLAGFLARHMRAAR